MLTIKYAVISCQMLALMGCTTGTRSDQIPILNITANHQLGGQARFSGRLAIQNRCLVAIAGNKIATPIFDVYVTLQPDASAISDAQTGVQIPLKRTFQAGAAWMREGGSGWSVSDIEAFFGIRIPRECPKADIIRLHDFKPDLPVHP